MELEELLMDYKYLPQSTQRFSQSTLKKIITNALRTLRFHCAPCGKK